MCKQEIKWKEMSLFLSLIRLLELLCCEPNHGTHPSTSRQSEVSSWEGWKDLDAVQNTPQRALLNT